MVDSAIKIINCAATSNHLHSVTCVRIHNKSGVKTYDEGLVGGMQVGGEGVSMGKKEDICITFNNKDNFFFKKI